MFGVLFLYLYIYLISVLYHLLTDLSDTRGYFSIFLNSLSALNTQILLLDNISGHTENNLENLPFEPLQILAYAIFSFEIDHIEPKKRLFCDII